MRDYMHIFGYCSQASDSEDVYLHTEDWLQEQQEKFNFVKYKDLDTNKLNHMQKLNEHGFKFLKHSRSEEKERIFGTHQEPTPMAFLDTGVSGVCDLVTMKRKN